jgi:hypothetical protein
MADFELSGLELLICPIVAPKYERDVHMAAPHPDRREPTFAELFTPKLVTLLRSARDIPEAISAPTPSRD